MSLAHSDEQWIAAMKAHGHKPIMKDYGDLDVFVLDVGYHNGPGCELCDEAWCQHCNGPEAVGPCSNAAIEGEAVEIKKERLRLP